MDIAACQHYLNHEVEKQTSYSVSYSATTQHNTALKNEAWAI